jgi:alkylation response protein AidB-like acyl-CoA dehydrogenase
MYIGYGRDSPPAIALHDDQVTLGEAVGGFVERRSSRLPQGLDELAARANPAVWQDLAQQGYSTLHLPEPHGGGTPLRSSSRCGSDCSPEAGRTAPILPR